MLGGLLSPSNVLEVRVVPSPRRHKLPTNQQLPSISDEHLETLTATRSQADRRAAARTENFEEAFAILQAVQHILGRPNQNYMLMENTLHALESRMRTLVQELCNLRMEEILDSHIEQVIWEETTDI
ncbi:hypothetical protein N7517_004728 [Penicillium concentricum]|uniref:Uncharacterized protein n=1 Tax=Penicillium concentricum TaxID=293559 RepID=A0A9W9S6W4_9EURO|nr:uncharacterized protein N7517_004728 [Penicillium concentricum]KAJ5372722.1 hypothetical protein N7517_004728 [Penicillium concentricum]